jgi:hypothetical protein
LGESVASMKVVWKGRCALAMYSIASEKLSVGSAATCCGGITIGWALPIATLASAPTTSMLLTILGRRYCMCIQSVDSHTWRKDGVPSHSGIAFSGRAP